ncbi:C-X-C motif chemokine 16 [Dendropsophus ebraccatus]|uniref:C-X-C motif chemokine 16 n=1 Tax=Dendropsophus ebraccatus TaxID=150705 RepID=UPI0038316B58
MRAPQDSGLLLLLFLLELTPMPGVAQIGPSFKYCQDCKTMPKKDEEGYHVLLVKNAVYEDCPHNRVKFRLPRVNICADKTDPWVRNVMSCIDQGRTPCLQPSTTQKEQTLQTTQESTAKTAPPLRQSTQTWAGGTLKPSEATTQEATMGLTSTRPDSEQNKDLLHGIGPTEGKDDDTKSKMNQMTIAVISLILIVLVMVAVGTYFGCRKMRFLQSRRPYVAALTDCDPTASSSQALTDIGP